MAKTHTPDWIISTKLAPPKLPDSLIERMRLLSKFQEALDFTLSLIHAPAGYGKSILLKQWHDLAIASDLPTAWLSLNEDDSQLEIFCCYLAAALEKASIPPPALHILNNRASEDNKVKFLAADFINAFSSFQKSAIVFLDDYHKITAKPIDTLIKTIATHAPHNLHIIIASRKMLDFSIESFKADMNFNQLTSNELKLTLCEFESMLTTALPPESLRYVWDRIEGWPIAARIANHSIEKNLISAEHITNFSGKTSDLSDYISDEIFSSLTKQEKTFLLTTCLSSRFNAELADKLCKTTRSYKIIDKLRKMDLFLVALDSENYWYRYHQLFQQYLTRKIHNEQPEKIENIRKTCASWLFENGYLQEAIEQALLSKDLSLAGRIIDSIGLWRLTIQGKISLSTTFLKKLPIEIIEKYPSLVVMHIFMHTKAGDIRYAKNQLHRFMKKSENITRWEGSDIEPKLRDCLKVIVTCLIDTYLDRPIDRRLLNSTYQLLSRTNPEDHIFLYTLHECLGHHLTDMADFDSALAHHSKSLMAANKLNSSYAEVYIFFHCVEIYLHKLEIRNAKKALEKAEKIIEDHYKNDLNLVHALLVFKAKLSYFKYNIDDAFASLNNIPNDSYNGDSWITLYIAFFDTKSAIEISRHNYIAATQLLDQAEIIAEDRLLTRLTQFAKILKTKISLLQGNLTESELDTLRINLEKINVQLDKSLSKFLPSLLLLTKARLLLQLNRTEEADNILGKLICDFKQCQHTRLLVEAYLIKSLSSYLQEKPNDACDFCLRATTLCISEKYKAAHMENAPTLLPIYKLTLKSSEEPLKGYLKGIIKGTASRTFNTHHYGLTEREFLTVCELAKGLSNREIAENICVSEDTVKYRLKSIYKKWQVSNRDEAVNKSIQLRLNQ